MGSMRRHAPHLLSSIKEDRLKGLSISELMRKYSLPKTTIWYQVKDITVPKNLLGLIKSKQGGSAQRSKDGWDAAQIAAGSILKDFDEQTIWPVLIAALYWSEGTKRSGFVFTNTDHIMIRVFLKILRERFDVRDDELDILIRTCTPMDPLMCRRYWSEVTTMPISRVRINHDDKQNKSKSTYGICRITLLKGGKKLKLMHCLIEGLADKMLGSSRSSTDRTSHS